MFVFVSVLFRFRIFIILDLQNCRLCFAAVGYLITCYGLLSRCLSLRALYASCSRINTRHVPVQLIYVNRQQLHFNNAGENRPRRRCERRRRRGTAGTAIRTSPAPSCPPSLSPPFSTSPTGRRSTSPRRWRSATMTSFPAMTSLPATTSRPRSRDSVRRRHR